MMSFLTEMRGDSETPSAVCLIVLFGCSNPSEVREVGLSSPDFMPFPATDVFRLVCIDNDEFGVSEAIQNLGTASERGEVYSSHAFMGCEKSPETLLRKSTKLLSEVKGIFKGLKLSNPPEVREVGLSSPDFMPFPATDVFRLVCIDNDELGVSEAIQNLGTASERGKVYSSHAFMGCEKSPETLLRKSSKLLSEVKDIFKGLKLSTDNNDERSEQQPTQE